MGCGASIGPRANRLQPLHRCFSASTLPKTESSFQASRRFSSNAVGRSITRTEALQGLKSSGRSFWPLRRKQKNSLLICGPPAKARSAYARREPTDEECRFIEMRVPSRERDTDDGSELDDAATNSTTTTTLSNDSRRRTPTNLEPPKDTLRVLPSKRTFLRGAADYSKKLEQIRAFRSNPPDPPQIKPKPTKILTKQKSSITALDAPIITHVTRRELMDECRSASGTPPTVPRRTMTPSSKSSLHGSKETLTSEMSFIVQHNTFRVLWEKDIYRERIAERQRARNCDSIESGDGTDEEDDASVEARRVAEERRKRREWSMELERIVQLDS